MRIFLTCSILSLATAIVAFVPAGGFATEANEKYTEEERTWARFSSRLRSPRLRLTVINECYQDMMRAEEEGEAIELDIAAPGAADELDAFCVKFINALAKGCISYEALLKSEETGEVYIPETEQECEAPRKRRDEILKIGK